MLTVQKSVKGGRTMQVREAQKAADAVEQTITDAVQKLKP